VKPILAFTIQVALCILAVESAPGQVAADERAPARRATRSLDPKQGWWTTLPPAPGSGRSFNAYRTRLQSGRRTFRYYPYPASSQSPNAGEYFDNVYAVVELYEALPDGVSQVAGDLVFLDGEEMPVTDYLLPEKIILYYPRSDFESVMRLLERYKSGRIEMFEAYEQSGDQRTQWTIGQLRFTGVTMGDASLRRPSRAEDIRSRQSAKER
jgi:hypothetical protein